MKSSMITTLIAVPLLSLSSAAFSAEPASTEPVLLSAVEMDGVTAGTYTRRNDADVSQTNRTRVNVTQVSAGNEAFGGNGGRGGRGGTGEGGSGEGGTATSTSTVATSSASANGTGGTGTGGAGGAGGAGGSASAGNQSAPVISGNISLIRQR